MWVDRERKMVPAETHYSDVWHRFANNICSPTITINTTNVGTNIATYLVVARKCIVLT
jgi:hypothetical protein